MLWARESRNARLAQCSDRSKLLYVLAKAHLDRAGRMPGIPAAVRGTVVPLYCWTDEEVDVYMREWTRTVDQDGHPAPLVRWYAVDGEAVLEFDRFTDEQRFPPKEPHSRLPAPTGDLFSTVPPVARPEHLFSTVPPEEATPLAAKALHPKREGEGKRERETQAAAAVEGPSPTELLLATFQEIFQRPARLREARRPRLEAVLGQLGTDVAVELMRERKAAGQDPASVAFFLPALEERAADLATVRELRGPRTTPLERCERWVRMVGWQLSSDEHVDEELISMGVAGGTERNVLVALARGLRREREPLEEAPPLDVRRQIETSLGLSS